MAVVGGAQGVVHEAEAAPVTPAAPAMLPPAPIITSAPASPAATTAVTVPAGALNKASCWGGREDGPAAGMVAGVGSMVQKELGHATCFSHTMRQTCPSPFHPKRSPAPIRINPTPILPPLLPTAGTTALATTPVAAATGAHPAEAAAARLVRTGARPGRIGEGASVVGGAKGAAHEAEEALGEVWWFGAAAFGQHH